MPIRALLFDLDDTLLETHESHAAAVLAGARYAATRQPGRSVEELAAAFHSVQRRLEATLEEGATYHTHELFRTATWRDALAEVGLSPELGMEAAQVYLAERRSRYRLYAEVPALLADLRRSYRLVLVTNGLADQQREKIRAVDLERRVDAVLVSGEVGSWKPDSGIFRLALERAGVGPEEALMLGDNPMRDVAGAQAVGIRAVWVRRYAHLTPAEGVTPLAELSDLRPLPGLLAGLAA